MAKSSPAEQMMLLNREHMNYLYYSPGSNLITLIAAKSLLDNLLAYTY